MMVLRAATRYLDKVILSYNLARAGGDPWVGAREGLVYYAQNAKPILITAVWIVILERFLTVVLWLVLLAPAGVITVMLPDNVRESGGIVTTLIAILLAGTLRVGVRQTAVSDHDPGALSRPDRESANQRRLGCPAGRRVGQIPFPGLGIFLAAGSARVVARRQSIISLRPWMVDRCSPSTVAAAYYIIDVA